MANKASLLELSRQIRHEMDSERLAFKRYSRKEFTDRLRSIGGEEGSRIKSGTAQEIERALQEQGFRVFPPLNDVEPEDEVRVLRAGTVACNLLDILLNPADKTDQELVGVMSKVKGEWPLKEAGRTE